MSAGKPCTDDTDGDAALNMRYNQQTSLPRVAYCDKPILTNRVTRIVKRHRQRVVENGNGFIKRDPMFSQAPLRLIWIPFELHEAIPGKVAAHLTV
jgi:hypothetical protein